MGVLLPILGVLAVVALVLFVLSLAAPAKAGRLLGRSPESSSRPPRIVFGALLGVLVVAFLVVLALPNYATRVEGPERLVAGDEHGLRLIVKNRGLVGGRFTKSIAIDGRPHPAADVNVPGLKTATVDVKLPNGLSAGLHQLAINNDTIALRVLRPADFSVTKLEGTGDIERVGAQVPITAAVKNGGEVDGEFAEPLRAGRETVKAEPTTIEPGQVKTIVYQVTGKRQGKLRLRLHDTVASQVVVKPVRYANGRYLRRARGGYGRMTINNRAHSDAVVVLSRTSAPKKPEMALYVRGGKRAKAANIPNGRYYVYVAYGSEWNTYTDAFLANSATGRFIKPLKYTTTSQVNRWSDARYRYSQRQVRYLTYSLTIGGGGDGTVVRSVAEEGFPRL